MPVVTILFSRDLRVCIDVVETIQQSSNDANTNGRRRRTVEIRKPAAVLVRNCLPVLGDRRAARDHILCFLSFRTTS